MSIGTGPAIASIVSSYTAQKEKKAELVKESKSENKSKEYERILTSIINQIGNKEDELIDSEKHCPECGRRFSILNIDNTEIDYCVYCHSVWFDFGELSKISGFSEDVPGQTLTDRESDYECPICNLPMKEFLFVGNNNLLVDKCVENHGVYLESGELRRVFEIAEKNNY